MNGPGYCICVPARNEADRLPVLLDALIAQDAPGPIPIAICINNSDDRSAAIAAGYAHDHADRLTIALDDCALPPAVAHVGTARGRAMDAGARAVGDAGVLIATDADCRPPPGWIAANMAAIERGADMVGGRIAVDEDEAIDPAIAAIRAQFDLYWTRVRAIEDAIDPQPHDPQPRHGDHTGASLAIRVDLYRRTGGVPRLASGEDRALVIAGLAAGGRLVHPLDVWTRASARRAGRAPGGMADMMAELEQLIDRGEEPRLPAFDHWRRRAIWRASRRADRDLALREAALPAMPRDTPLSALL